MTKDYDYTLRLTLEEPPQEERNKAKVAIEVGWRLFETGLRVAVALGEDGELINKRSNERSGPQAR